MHVESSLSDKSIQLLETLSMHGGLLDQPPIRTVRGLVGSVAHAGPGC